MTFYEWLQAKYNRRPCADDRFTPLARYAAQDESFPRGNIEFCHLEQYLRTNHETMEALEDMRSAWRMYKRILGLPAHARKHEHVLNDSVFNSLKFEGIPNLRDISGGQIEDVEYVSDGWIDEHGSPAMAGILLYIRLKDGELRVVQIMASDEADGDENIGTVYVEQAIVPGS